MAHGLIPVRLDEIPYEKRMTAARLAARECNDEDEANEVLLAALFPSSRVHWVRAQAVELVESLRAAA